MDKVQIIETVEFEKCVFYFRADKILIIHLKDNVRMEIEDAMEQHEYIKQKTDFLPLKTLVIPGRHASITPEVKEFSLTKESSDLVKCQAIVVQSLAHRLIATFILKLNKMPVRYKLFTNQEDGIDWLLKQA